LIFSTNFKYFKTFLRFRIVFKNVSEERRCFNVFYCVSERLCTGLSTSLSAGRRHSPALPPVPPSQTASHLPDDHHDDDDDDVDDDDDYESIGRQLRLISQTKLNK